MYKTIPIPRIRPSIIRGMYITVILCLLEFRHKSKNTIVPSTPIVNQNPILRPSSYYASTIVTPKRTTTIKSTGKKSSVDLSSVAMKQKVNEYGRVIYAMYTIVVSHSLYTPPIE